MRLGETGGENFMVNIVADDDKMAMLSGIVRPLAIVAAAILDVLTLKIRIFDAENIRAMRVLRQLVRNKFAAETSCRRRMRKFELTDVIDRHTGYGPASKEDRTSPLRVVQDDIALRVLPTLKR
jgi:hypothetical protein